MGIGGRKGKEGGKERRGKKKLWINWDKRKEEIFLFEEKNCE